MQSFRNSDGLSIVLRMVEAVRDNRVQLGQADAAIGDGDHGANMSKGFTMFQEQLGERKPSFTQSIDELGQLLLGEIGGSMGPIYGTIFMEMALAGEGAGEIGAPLLDKMLSAGLEGLYDLVEARVGDKTLVDTLAPACATFHEAAGHGLEFKDALETMKEAAIQGCASTVDLVAKFGRGRRLGDKTVGFVDAGALSCRIILCAMADGIMELLSA